MKNSYIVYKHTNLINNKIYIGITVYGENPNLRWQNGNGYSQNKKFFQDILKFGWDNFSHEILYSNLTELEALKIEASLIKKYNCVEEGYNNSYGGNVHGEESRKKISKALTGIKRSQDSIQKQIDTKLKNSGNGSGIDFSKENLSSRRVRCKETQDVFCSITEAENWCHSVKVGECCSGIRQHAGKHPDTGMQLSWEYVSFDTPVTKRCPEKYETKKIQKIKCVETGKIYNSASEAFKETGIATCNILRVCHGQRKSAGKLHWEFYKGE